MFLQEFQKAGQDLHFIDWVHRELELDWKGCDRLTVL